MSVSERFIKKFLSRAWVKWRFLSIDIFRDGRRSLTRRFRQYRRAERWRANILASRRRWRAGPFKLLFNDIEQFPVLLCLFEILYSDKLKSRRLNGVKHIRKKLRKAVAYLREDNIQAAYLAIKRLNNERDTHPETKVFCLIAEILICLIQKQTLRAIEIANGPDFNRKDISTDHPVFSIAHFFSASQLSTLAEKEMARQNASPLTARSRQSQNLLICIEGNVDPDFVDFIISRSFFNARKVTICFLTRRGDILDRFRHYFQHSSRECSIDIYDLPVDFAGTYSDASSSSVEYAFRISEEIVHCIIESTSGTTRDHALYFHDAIALYLEDHYFALLRRIGAAQQLLKNELFDGGLVISTNHFLSIGIAALVSQRLGPANTYYLNAGGTIDSFSIAHRVINHLLTQKASAQKELPCLATRSHRLGSANISKADFFSYIFGPIRLPRSSSLNEKLYKSTRLYNDLSQSAEALRKAYGDHRLGDLPARPLNINIAPKIFGDPSAAKDREPWLCLVFRSDDPIARAAYEAILSIYARSTKLLLIDLAAKSNTDYHTFANAVLRQARLTHVWSAGDVADPKKCRAAIKVEIDKMATSDAFRIAHKRAGNVQLFGLNDEFLQSNLEFLGSRVAADYLPNIINMIGNCVSIFQDYMVECVICTPTRNPRMRAIVQCARLWGIPSVEPQVVLNGRLIRQRAPNTDFTAVLETWSQDLYNKFFKYPSDRIVLGGSIRYDRILQSLSSFAAVQAISTLRHTLFPGSRVKYLILFGSQPTELAERLEGFRSLLICCSKIEGAFVVVKPHPRESRSNKQYYLQVIKEVFLPERAVVVDDIDTYHLIMASDLVVAQTSNILLEAGFLDKRALSIDFGNSSRAIDFEEMGVAVSAKTPEAIEEKLPGLLLNSPEEHPLDKTRRDFIKRNPQLLSINYIQTLQSVVDKAINAKAVDVDYDQERLIDYLIHT